MLNRDRLRDKLDRQTARDHTRMRHWSERREGKIMRDLDSPVLPAFCRVCLIGMLVGAFMASTGDMARPGHGAWRSAATSALMAWLLFGVPLVIGCLIQLKRGFDHPWFSAHRLNRRGQLRMPWAKKYRLWAMVAVIGAMLLCAARAVLPG